MKYLSKTAVINAAQKSGSAAKTYNGAVKHLVKNAADPSELHERGKRATRHNRGEGCCQSVCRDSYGQLLISGTVPTRRRAPELAAYAAAVALVGEAARAGAITPAYNSIFFDKKGRASNTARHHELYDFAPDAALICVRETEGGRYGVKTTSKKYLLIERTPGITASPTTLPVAKFAKLIDIAYGEIIARVRGEAGAILLPPTIEFEPAYKALAADGEILRSIFSGEEYRLGNLKRQRAQDDHEGGYYCYGSIEAALQADVPEESKCLDLPRVIVRCEVAGREVVYNGGKKSRTYLRPLEIVASRI